MSAERLEEKTRIFSEFAESFLWRLSKVLEINDVPSELAIAIRHPSVNKSTRTQHFRRSSSDWPTITAFGSEIEYAGDDSHLEGLGKSVWTLCLSLTATDIGIVQRFGAEAGDHFV